MSVEKLINNYFDSKLLESYDDEDIYTTGAHLFKWVTNVKVKEGTIEISDKAFYESLLKSIKIASSVENIGDEAFYQCSCLTSVIFETPSSMKSIGCGAFSYCESLTSITIPNGVTKIGGNAFKGCKSLTSITIPNSVTEISRQVFFDCNTSLSIKTDNKYVQDYCDKYKIKWEPITKTESLTPRFRFKLVETLQPILCEELINDADIEMLITDSEYEVKNKLLSSQHLMRVFYDQTIDKYMVCDGHRWVHKDMVVKALQNGYYEFGLGFMGIGLVKVIKNKDKLLFISYCPKDSQIAQNYEKLLDDVASDGYTKEYIFEDGYIFSQETAGTLSFANTGLYDALGKCIKVNDLDDAPLVQK